MSHLYKKGLEILGAQVTNRAVLIKINNAAQLARSQGAAASFAQMIAPATIEAKVYDTMADKLAQSLKDNNVDATVTVVEPTAWQAADGKHIWQDVALGIGTVGVLALVWRLVGGRKK